MGNETENGVAPITPTTITPTTITPTTIALTTIDGVQLAADVATARTDQPVRGAVVIAHPHPLFGGDRFNPMVDAMFDVLPTFGFHALRFDFRGAGESFGEHDDGDAERLDIASGIDFLAQILDDDFHNGIWVVGYSFGSIVGLNVVEPRVAGWVAIAPPITSMPNAQRVLSARDPRPKLLVVAEHDQFSSPAQVRATVDGWSHTQQTMVSSVDHFLLGQTRPIAESVATWLTRATPS